MKNTISILIIMTLILGLLCSCSPEGNLNNTIPTVTALSNSENEDTTNSTAEPAEVDFTKTDADMFTERDFKTEYIVNEAVTINLEGSSATASSDSVNISGSEITVTEEATYVISGNLTDGMLIVNAPDTAKLQLVFSGVTITNKSSAALYIKEADKVFLTLANGTINTLANGGSFASTDENNIDSALFSNQDLTINGNGTLNITSPAGHGIVCKDDLVITGGKHIINSASHGLDANDSIRIASSELTIDAGKDAIHAENTDDSSLGFIYISSGKIKADAEGDGIDAGAYLQIADCTIDLLVGGGSENGSKEHSDSFGRFMDGGKAGGMHPENIQTGTTITEDDSTSMKGLKATNGILISNGTFNISSADDSIHSDTSITVNGGKFSIASGDDAVHAEETLTVTAGDFNISECYEGLEALNIEINGGSINLKASDDGINAAGGMDMSGFEGGRDGMFGDFSEDAGRGPGGRGPGGKGGGMPGGMSSNSNGSIVISGGTLFINSSGDGMDANGTIKITDGNITVVGPTQGDTATLDYDKSATISGGTFIGTGASGMAQSFSDSSQGIIAINSGNQTADTQITLRDSNGNTIISYKPVLDFAVVILSAPEIIKGEVYSLSIGSATEELKAE